MWLVKCITHLWWAWVGECFTSTFLASLMMKQKVNFALTICPQWSKHSPSSLGSLVAPPRPNCTTDSEEDMVNGGMHTFNQTHMRKAFQLMNELRRLVVFFCTSKFYFSKYIPHNSSVIKLQIRAYECFYLITAVLLWPASVWVNRL